MKSLREMWLSALLHSPEQVAIVAEGKRLTYRQVLERALRLGSALYAKGLRAQDRVAVLAMNCTEWYDVCAACHVAGYVMNTVNFRLAAPEIVFILQDSAAKVLIYEEQYEAIIAEIRPLLPHIETYIRIGSPHPASLCYEAFIAGGDAAGAPIAATPESYAHLIYTSGTTGRPKGVIRTQRAEASNSAATALFMGMTFGGSLLLMMPMFHIGALGEAMGQLFCRGTVVLHRAFDPVNIARTLQDEKINCTHMAPTMVQAFLDVPNIREYDLSHLNTLCYAAAPMPVSVLKRGIELLGPIFVDCYGSTELAGATALHKHLHRIDGSAEEIKRLGSVGQALTHCEIRIVNDSGEVIAAHETGEVSVRSDAALAFYWNNHTATMAALSDGWFATGDMGFLDERGFLFLVDRKKDMIISGGENIYCREVEEALMSHGGIAEVAVIGVPDDYWGEAVKAIVVRKPGSAVTADELIAHCLKMIARYKRPKTIDFIDQLPWLPSGKVNKVALRQQYAPKA